MRSHWVNDAPYYRCRFPNAYALANRVEHPLNVNLREDAVIGHVDRWLDREFARTVSLRSSATSAKPASRRSPRRAMTPRARSPSATGS